MGIGQKIKELRVRKNLTQMQLAEAIGMINDMVSFYEKEQKKPSLKAIEKMAKVFEVNTNYFLDEKQESIQFNSESISEKLYSELKLQFEFLQRNFERVIEENGRLSRTLENLTSTGNFQEGNNLSALPIIGEVVTLAAA